MGMGGGMATCQDGDKGCALILHLPLQLRPAAPPVELESLT